MSNQNFSNLKQPTGLNQMKCPQCGRMTIYSIDNKARPFCSERCQLIDLGQWANEDYKIALSQDSVQVDDFSDNENDSNE